MPKVHRHSFNKPFKERVHAKYVAWMVNGPFEYSPAGKKKALSCNSVLQWVNEAWEDILEEMVRNSFKSCSISNALDDTEDHLDYEEDDGQEGDDDLDNEFQTDSEAEDK